MRLHRLSAHRDGLRKIRAGLGRRHSASSDGYQPYRFQVYAWEASQAFLLLSVVLMVVGIAVLVWVSTEYGPDKPYEDGWWDENSKVSFGYAAPAESLLTGSDGCHIYRRPWVRHNSTLCFAGSIEGNK